WLWTNPGPGALVRDARSSSFRAGGTVPVVRAAGAPGPRVGGEEAGLGRQEDRQRPSALGLRGDRLPVSARQRAGQAVEAEAGEEARPRQGPGHPGGTPGSECFPHDPQRGGLRRGPLLGTPSQRPAAGPEQKEAGRVEEEGELRDDEAVTGSSSLFLWESSYAGDRLSGSA